MMTNQSQTTATNTHDDSSPSSSVSAVEDPETEPTNRAQKRAARTRRKLVKSALELFSSAGFAATTIEEITENADLGKGTFYRHFSGKEELQEELLIDSILRLQASLQSGRRPRQSLKEALERIFEVHARSFRRQRAAYFLLADRLLNMHANRESSGLLAEQFNRYLELQASMLDPFLQPARDPQVDRVLASSICGMVVGSLTFCTVELPADRKPTHLSSLRRSFVAGCQAMLPTPAAARSKTRKT